MEFGHHPEPAIDFTCEVDAIEGEITDRAAGLPATMDLGARIERAMQFKVGGDAAAVVAKADLRKIAAAFKAGAGSAIDGADTARAPSDAERALDLLDTLFTAYEDGYDVWEDPKECSGHMGHAVKLDEATFNACIELLNRTRPRGVPAASGLAQPLATAVEAIEADHDPLCMAVLRGKACTCGVRLEGIDGPRHGPAADGSQKPNDAAAIPCAKAGSNSGVPANHIGDANEMVASGVKEQSNG